MPPRHSSRRRVLLLALIGVVTLIAGLHSYGYLLPSTEEHNIHRVRFPPLLGSNVSIRAKRAQIRLAVEDTAEPLPRSHQRHSNMPTRQSEQSSPQPTASAGSGVCQWDSIITNYLTKQFMDIQRVGWLRLNIEGCTRARLPLLHHLENASAANKDASDVLLILRELQEASKSHFKGISDLSAEDANSSEAIHCPNATSVVGLLKALDRERQTPDNASATVFDVQRQLRCYLTSNLVNPTAKSEELAIARRMTFSYHNWPRRLVAAAHALGTAEHVAKYTSHVAALVDDLQCAAARQDVPPQLTIQDSAMDLAAFRLAQLSHQVVLDRLHPLGATMNPPSPNLNVAASLAVLPPSLMCVWYGVVPDPAFAPPSPNNTLPPLRTALHDFEMIQQQFALGQQCTTPIVIFFLYTALAGQKSTFDSTFADQARNTFSTLQLAKSLFVVRQLKNVNDIRDIHEAIQIEMEKSILPRRRHTAAAPAGNATSANETIRTPQQNDQFAFRIRRRVNNAMMHDVIESLRGNVPTPPHNAWLQSQTDSHEYVALIPAGTVFLPSNFIFHASSAKTLTATRVMQMPVAFVAAPFLRLRQDPPAASKANTTSAAAKIYRTTHAQAAPLVIFNLHLWKILKFALRVQGVHVGSSLSGVASEAAGILQSDFVTALEDLGLLHTITQPDDDVDCGSADTRVCNVISYAHDFASVFPQLVRAEAVEQVPNSTQSSICRPGALCFAVHGVSKIDVELVQTIMFS